jgi:bacillithiol biosynthesis cysteine-adding enzyme BshC
VDPHCIPVSSIPHTTRLFDDFLHHFDRVRRFYAQPPLSRDWWDEERQRIDYPDARRRAVADVLERQNREFGAGEKTLQNIGRLRQGAPAVVTGQQVGLFGGPLYCLWKALSVAALTESTGAVPIFWLAGEDHDFEEINYAQLAKVDHLAKLTINVPHPEDAPVGTIVFGDEVTAAVKQVEELFGVSAVTELLAASYRKGENFAGAFARFYAQALSELGIIFLNPLEPELHRQAHPLYRGALEKSSEINQALQARNHELEAAGYHAQVNVTPSHTLCFYFENGSRVAVRDQGDNFLVGERRVGRAELMAEAEQCPERFSANVLLRPVIEDYLLPTLCYIGGPAEVAYFAQVETVYRQLGRRVTPVVPRLSATIVEPRQAKLLDRYGLNLQDTFIAPEKLEEVVASKAMPDGLMKSFDRAAENLQQDLRAIREDLEKLDRTLVDAADNAASKMTYQLQGLRDKASRAEARKNTELKKHADELSTYLFPNKELQERGIGAVYFLLQHGGNLVEKLKHSAKFGCAEHQVVLLEKMFSPGSGEN